MRKFNINGGESKYGEIFYHNNLKECDFILRKGLKIDKVMKITESIYNAVTRERGFKKGRQVFEEL